MYIVTVEYIWLEVILILKVFIFFSLWMNANVGKDKKNEMM